MKSKKEAYSIRDMREITGLNQEEFSFLAGISSVYQSQIETGSRPLTDETAIRIAITLTLLSEPEWGEFEDFLTEYQLMGYEVYGKDLKDTRIFSDIIKIHNMVSRRPKEIQSELKKLLLESYRLNIIVDFALLNDVIPDSTDKSKRLDEEVILKRLDWMIDNNDVMASRKRKVRAFMKQGVDISGLRGTHILD